MITFNDDELDDFQPKGVKVPLKPYVAPAPSDYQLITDDELRSNVGKVMVFDVESYPNFWMVAFKLVGTNKVLIFTLRDGERFDNFKLSWVLHNYTCVGFNCNKYDIPMIWLAYFRPLVKYLNQASTSIIQSDMRCYQTEREFKFQCYKTKVIDLIEVCPVTGSLKTYGARLHSSRIQDLPFDPWINLTLEQQNIVMNYCINDLDVTELIFVNLKEELELRDTLTKEYNVDLMSKSDAQIAEYVIAAEIERLTGVAPRKPKIVKDQVDQYKVPGWMRFQTPQMQNVLEVVRNAYYGVMDNGKVLIPQEIKDLNIVIGNSTYRMGNGGLHSSEKKITHKIDDETLILDRDVVSYYPYIVINQGLMPEHLGKVFLQVYKSIVDRRIKAKKAKLKAIAQALKITVNGAFGKLGSPWSILYAPDLMIQVTVSGQLCLLMLIEMMELAGIEVISANTDGIVMRVPKQLHNVYFNVVAEWERITGFVTEETTYTSVHSRDVNAYLAVKPQDKNGVIEVKGKNIFFNPWDAGSDYSIFRFHKNPMATVCITACELKITRGVPIEQTIQECKDIRKFILVKNVRGGAHKDNFYLGKVVRFYYAIGVYGNINYVIGNRKVSESDGGKPCMDLPKTFPNDINYNVYIERAYQMLSDMGYFQRFKEKLLF